MFWFSKLAKGSVIPVHIAGVVNSVVCWRKILCTNMCDVVTTFCSCETHKCPVPLTILSMQDSQERSSARIQVEFRFLFSLSSYVTLFLSAASTNSGLLKICLPPAEYQALP